ncbi:MAG: response regulator transcription factor [Saprospiraceae bacterium]
MSEIRILIVEDEPFIAQDIAAIIEGIDYEVAHIAYDAEAALAFIEKEIFDLAILDVNLGGEKDGIDIGKVLFENKHTPFIYLTSYADRKTLEKAKPTRPKGYLVKPFDEKDLFSAIEIALFNHAQEQKPVSFNLDELNDSLLANVTPKEFEIMLDLYEGKTNQQIAAKHFISINTVKTHVKNLYSKLHVQSRTDLIIWMRKKMA